MSRKKSSQKKVRKGFDEKIVGDKPILSYLQP